MRSAKFIGVFSERNEKTAQKSGRNSRRYYFCWDLGNGNFALQELDSSFSPVAPPRRASAEGLKTHFIFEPGILAAPVSAPDMRQQPAEKPDRKATELNDNALAALEKARKARQVENDLRNSFDKALRALGRPRDRKGALAALGQLAETTEGIVPEHKHMFRDFGVSLRKKAMPELALRYAARAAQLAPNDDHALFNLARLLGMLGRYTEAEKHLARAIKLDKKEAVYPRLLAWLNKEKNG